MSLDIAVPSPPREELSDADLLRAYLATGSRERLDEIVRRHASLVQGVCRRVLADDATADDAAQATFLLLMSKRERLRDDTVLSRWLYWTARHVARSARRSALARRRREVLGLRVTRPIDDDPDQAQRGEMLERVEEALAALPEPQREAILLHHARGLSLEEAAHEAGCPMRTLQSRLGRGMARLREKLSRGDEAMPLATLVAALGGGKSAGALAGLHAASPAAVKLAGAAKGAAVGASLKTALLVAAAIALAATAAVPLVERARAPAPTVQPVPVQAMLAADGVIGRHPQDHVYCLAFAPDGGALVSGGEGGAIVWDLATRTERSRLEHPGAVRSLAFTPDGRRLLSGGADGVARIWDAAGGGEALPLRGHGSAIFRVALSPDGATAATGSDDTTIRLWRVADGQPLGVLTGHGDCLRGLAFTSPTTLVSGANDRTVRAWSLDATRPQETEPTPAAVIDLAVSPLGDRVAVVAGSEVALRDARTLATMTVLRADARQALCARFSPDGALVATGGDEGVLRLWDARSGERLAELKSKREIVCVAFSPDGSRIAMGSWGPEVSLARVKPR